MRKVFVLVAIVGIVISACQKEIDWGFADLANQQLIRISSVSGSDSTIVNFGYDSQKRLISEITELISAGSSAKDTFIINRSSTGVINTTVQKGNSMVPGIDSLVTLFYYNNTTSRYYAATRLLDVGGFSITDSAEYSYDASGRIVLEKHFFITGLFPVFEAAESQYVYSTTGTKLDTARQYIASGPPPAALTLFTTQTFSYDAKTTPLLLKNEAILLGRLNYYSANNASHFGYKDETDPTQDFSIDYIYKYNMAGKPDSATATQVPGGTVTASKYFYQ
jgi:hypothetical protein